MSSEAMLNTTQEGSSLAKQSESRKCLPLNVLFIQGGGEGAYEADKKLAASLQKLLGEEYQVHYPMMPNQADPAYETYKTQVTAQAGEETKGGR